MDFKTFITQFQNVETPMGDFAADIARDTHFPDAQNHSVLKQYFSDQARRYHNDELLRLFNIAWDFYSEIR